MSCTINGAWFVVSPGQCFLGQKNCEFLQLGGKERESGKLEEEREKLS